MFFTRWLWKGNGRGEGFKGYITVLLVWQLKLGECRPQVSIIALFLLLAREAGSIYMGEDLGGISEMSKT